MRHFFSMRSGRADSKGPAPRDRLPRVADPSLSLRMAWRARPVRLIVYFGLVLVVAIAVAGAFAISNLRNNILAENGRQLQNVAAVLAEHFERTFEALTLTQLGFVQHVQSLKIESSEDFENQVSGFDVHLMLKERIVNLRPVHALMLVNSRGQVINFSRDWPIPYDDVADQDYFKAFQSSFGLSSSIGAPMRSRATGAWVFHVAHKVIGPDGQFLGLVVGVMELKYFEELFAPLSLGSGSSIALIRRDGRVLARYPELDLAAAPSFASGPLFRDVLPRAGRGVVRLTGLLDQRDRFVAGHNLVNHAAAVTVGMEVEAILAEWRKAALFMGGIAALMMVVLGSMVFLCARRVGANLSKQKFRLDTALNNMTHGLCMFDAKGTLVIHNARYLEIFKLPPGLIKPGCSLRELLKHLDEAGIVGGDQEQYATELMSSVREGKAVPFLRQLNDGRTILITNQPLADGGWIATHQDITERLQAESQIAYMAHHDALTGLPNRALFCEELDRALARIKRGGHLALLYLDLDHFKRVNDTLGHLLGDELLKLAAERLRGCVRETDFIARLGGDEFAVIQTALEQPSDAAALAMRISEAIRSPFDLEGHRAVVDVSIGISVAPGDASARDQLLKNADLGLYGAKGGGRGIYQFYEPEMDERMKARQKLETDLRDALANGEFELHYQPVVNLHSNEISGCEALLRWRHPERGIVAPSEFIPITEESGLIVQLGEWALRQACAQAASWPDHIKVAVNLSPVQLKGGKLVGVVVNALATSGLPACRLELEITENVLVQNTFATLTTLHQLRKLGVRISMDDFGIGYSSLSYLRSFPFDNIKIDRSFIREISERDDCVAIVRAVTNMARDLNMTTIAEGVETEQQRQKVRELGCTEMQGYLFSRPRPANEIVRLFQQRAERTASAA